jgi:signal-transduction protein with cAMP-binding, CBS, and nucleotidyltransferase domain
MCQPAITIDADDVVSDATWLLKKQEIHMLPVMQKGQLVGIVRILIGCCLRKPYTRQRPS